MDTSEPLVLLGCGFTGTYAAKLALAAGTRVVGTTRSPERAAFLSRLGVDVRLAPRLDVDLVAPLLHENTRVLVTYPPDDTTDAALLPLLSRAASAVYLSSTGVYGNAAGRIDEQTPVDPSEPRAAARLRAEALVRAAGGVVLRAAAIYGPGRGLHVRLARGEHKIAEGGQSVISRIHVQDLARFALAALDRAPKGEVFVVADDAPVPQAEVIDWLCARLGVPRPAEVPRADLPPTLRNDRRVDAGKIRRSLGVSLDYPTYREGFAACLAEEAHPPDLVRK
ncbi:NAD-dependent epimerase/dehydratase family protein [Polyangium mundeleinium]|uniref:NAD-dependent epimerase/dehydratase family protein n=1 Tax=Polyangium mundeleinium TaxID=2995306 RepID=A0ABT5EHG9_9BACT|nr:NAD-dependent epimerase/dehydratase family protein [Polyangium mundeleinium]MDC0741253.1 NAD-dependent epimerase/dehydratase family protein [Polyangium mundeleinium]